MTELNMEPEISDRDLLLAFDRSFDPPSECGVQRCRDSFPEFIYIVVVPAAVLLLVIHVILFSLLVCCCVKRRRKPVAESYIPSEEQLAMYEAIRRASAGVRRMSHGATTPLLDSRSGSMSLVRNDHRRRGFRPRDSCHSAPGTLQR
ncbi:uncharacterized protein [Littorina saxatilis]|uniref:uncharacterized protein n=1 Tax=Littorina saxatilis TaxID=31220 RepID=UPI0038B606E8